jgi:hypothetical protein
MVGARRRKAREFGMVSHYSSGKPGTPPTHLSTRRVNLPTERTYPPAG